jgi:hypothetical protein
MMEHMTCNNKKTTHNKLRSEGKQKNPKDNKKIGEEKTCNGGRSSNEFIDNRSRLNQEKKRQLHNDGICDSQ